MRFPGGALTWDELRGAVTAAARQVEGCRRVALWAEPTLETAIGVIGALVAGVTVVPINPSIGSIELEHILGEAKPDGFLCGPHAVDPLPPQLTSLSCERFVVDVNARSSDTLPP